MLNTATQESCTPSIEEELTAMHTQNGIAMADMYSLEVLRETFEDIKERAANLHAAVEKFQTSAADIQEHLFELRREMLRVEALLDWWHPTSDTPRQTVAHQHAIDPLDDKLSRGCPWASPLERSDPAAYAQLWSTLEWYARAHMDARPTYKHMARNLNHAYGTHFTGNSLRLTIKRHILGKGY